MTGAPLLCSLSIPATNPALERIVITNTIPPPRLETGLSGNKLAVDASSLFAEAIRRISSDGSIVDLLEV
jgi:ribose-phosphate pyrophosphokinase